MASTPGLPSSTATSAWPGGSAGGGWFPFLQRIGAAAAQTLRQRVAAELKTTFASVYAKEISLAEALQLDVMQAYGLRATGTKYLINPSKGLAA